MEPLSVGSGVNGPGPFLACVCHVRCLDPGNSVERLLVEETQRPVERPCPRVALYLKPEIPPQTSSRCVGHIISGEVSIQKDNVPATSFAEPTE